MARRATKKVPPKRPRASADDISRTPEYRELLADITQLIRTAKQTPARRTNPPRVTMRELNLARALCSVMKPEVMEKWLVKPNAAFDGEKPIELIKRGETRRLWQMVYELRAGTPL